MNTSVKPWNIYRQVLWLVGVLGLLLLWLALLIAFMLQGVLGLARRFTEYAGLELEE
jgi:hypothetical protein